MPDDLDRLFERLVRVLADEAPGRLAVPFPAAEVYERLVPYRSNRSALKVATHQDYEMAVLRLLSGERGYVALAPAVPVLRGDAAGGPQGELLPAVRPAAIGRAALSCLRQRSGRRVALLRRLRPRHRLRVSRSRAVEGSRGRSSADVQHRVAVIA